MDSPDVSKINKSDLQSDILPGGNSGSGDQILQETIIDNPHEMEMLEEDEEQDEDPETLEELDRRHEEIIEQFMDLSLNTKHDLREKIMTEFPDIDPTELKSRLKEVDQKRKDGLKILKNKLADIIQDEELNADQKLQKLYDESEITEFMQNLLQ
jgi:hypothetical protein